MDKHYNHQKAQEEIQHKWQKEQTYTIANNPGPLFSIDTPPPTVSGNLHIGHIFSYTQTDILARFARMNGKSVFYPFGFDDNGLPTERYVEKKLDIRAHEMSRTEFINVCLKETHEVEQEFKTLWQKVGLSADWNYCYSTISAQTRKISQESFLRLLQKEYVYRKNEPALYCTTCRTSVAQAELDDMQKPSVFYDITFPLDLENSITIATTRPELLGSCIAIFFHPDDARYKHLYKKLATVPLFNYQVPILTDDKVDPAKGTGLVMCCTFGDKTDVEWYKKYESQGLIYRPSIGKDGKMLPIAEFQDTDSLAGLTVAQARIKIVESLKRDGYITSEKPITHNVNVHERCKKEIEILMLPQWFLKLLPYKQQFIDMADKISWYPAHMKSRYSNWVQNLSWDWCLSRQRFYGIPFPVWHCQKCNHIITPSFDQLPIDPQETSPKSGCPSCKSTDIIPDTDVMDTWNTSSLTPYICFNLLHPDKNPFDASVHSDPSTLLRTKGQPVSPPARRSLGEGWVEPLPMSMRPQAHDIIRTWAFDTIVKAWMHDQEIPWETIVISGHVLADSKEKLSKSKENAKSSPQALLEQYPADVIRYWTASGGLGQDIAFSEAQLKIGQRLITKVWNAFRFIHEHTSVVHEVDPSQLGITNEWLLHEATQAFNKYHQYLSQNEFNLALDAVEKFFWHSFCDNYLELIKDQLFKPDNYSTQEVQATRWTLKHTGLRILQLYAPYLPYITEHLYGLLYQSSIGTASIHQLRYALVQTSYNYEKSTELMKKIINIIADVRKLKTAQQLSLKAPLKQLIINCASDSFDILKSQLPLIAGITHAQEIINHQAHPRESYIEQANDEWIIHVNLRVKDNE